MCHILQKRTKKIRGILNVLLPIISKGYLSLLNFFTQKLIEKPRNFFKITANFYHFLILTTGYFYVKSLLF